MAKNAVKEDAKEKKSAAKGAKADKGATKGKDNKKAEKALKVVAPTDPQLADEDEGGLLPKGEQVRAIAEMTNLSQREVKSVIDGYQALALKELDEFGEFRMDQLGTFRVDIRAAREGRNLQTKEIVMVPEKRVLRFKTSRSVKRLLNPVD